MEGASLVVADDDDRFSLRLVGKRLEERGYRVLAVSDGHQALEAVRCDRLAAEGLDRVMTRLEGDEVCARLKADPRTAAIPVVLLSARAMSREATEVSTGVIGRLDACPFQVRPAAQSGCWREACSIPKLNM